MVVTGIGSVSPLGEGAEFWDGLIAGRSGIVPLPSWADEYPAKVSEEQVVKSFRLIDPPPSDVT